jgi:hypothetical protein
VTLAGYLPLTAIMPLLAPERKSAAISMLNLEAGASALLGPAIVAVFIGPLGVEGVMWIFAGLYALSAVLALFLRLPEEVERGTLGWSGIGEAAFGGSACLLAHPPAMAALAGQHDIDLVLFDLGGTMYDDNSVKCCFQIRNPLLYPAELRALFYGQFGTLRASVAPLCKRYTGRESLRMVPQ